MKMKDRNLISTPIYPTRLLARVFTIGREANYTARYANRGFGEMVIKKRLMLFIALALFITAAPFLTAQGYGSSSEPGQTTAPTSLSSQAQSSEGDDKFRRVSKPIQDHYIVVLKKDLASRDVESLTNDLTARHGGNAKHVYRHAIKGFSAQMTEAAAIALSKDPQVEYVEEDGKVFISTTQNTDTNDFNLWGLDRIDQRNLTPSSHTYNYSNVNTGTGIHAYVIDSGIQVTHRDFRRANGSSRAINNVDFVNDGWNGGDCNGHGTFVAGIIGGNTFGVAKDVSLHSVRVFGCDDWTWGSTIIAGIDWVTANHISPAVANLSLGVDPDSIFGGIDYGIEDAVRGCIAAGVTCVVAAGNDNRDARDTSPARVEEAITVGATDFLDRRAYFSNFGPAIDLFAPGMGIVSANNTDENGNGILDDFTTGQGTSFAAPHVTGTVARFLQNNPTASPATAQGAIKGCATRDKVDDPGWASPNLLLYSEIRPALLNQSSATISEASQWVNTGVDVGPDQWLSLNAGGEIWSGVWLSGNNGPQGWNRIENSAYFPLPGSRPFSLVGRMHDLPPFYVGLSNARADNLLSAKRLYLRTNDDVPGDGNGAFNCQIQVWKKLPDASADFANQSVPTTMLAGQTVTVSVTMKNTGLVTWTAGQNYRLGPQPDGLTWGVSRITVPYDVAPGSFVTFTFNVTAPSVPGVYNFRWRMLQEGVQWFGDVTDIVPVTVLAPSNQAMFVSQTVPRPMNVSEYYTVSVTMKNVGTTTWQAGTNYRLGSQNPQDNTRWGINRVPLPHSVPPGAQVTFTFLVFSPVKAGSYNFQWRMVQDGVEWFGDYTPNVVVSVRPVCTTC